MDLSQYLQNGADAPAEAGQQLSKEEYAALKKQEREEVWAEVDSKAQEVFQDGESLKSFLNFMAQCKPQKAANLLLLYGQNPEIRQVKTFDGWKKEHKTLRAGARGYTFIADQNYEKDGETRQGYVITKAYDISQIRTKQPEPPEPKPIQTLMGALLKDTETKISIADNLPEHVQAQYIPRERTIFVRNGMSEEVTFHAINRELACASMDAHDGTYSRKEAAPQAFCAAYVMAEKYGVDNSGFDFNKICEMQGYGNKEPQELRAFIGNVKNAVYSISRHVNRNLGQPEQEFMPDEFAVSEGMKGDVQPEAPKPEAPAEKGQKQRGGKSRKQAER
nr:ArdC family protein [uncultured Schaedlerella sp.]